MIKVFSYGGGVQSTAALVLAAQGQLDYQTFLFCNVGEDSEHPATLTYVHEVAMPYAKAHGIDLIELQKVLKDGSVDTVYQRLTRPGSRSIGIPVRMNGSGAPGNRTCTYDFKVAVVDKWLKTHTTAGLVRSMKEKLLAYYVIKQIDKETLKRLLLDIDTFFGVHEPVAHVGLGISLDEIGRMKPNMSEDTFYWKVNTFPLIVEIPRPLTRQDCVNIILKAGLSVPPKSSCWFCPFHTLRRWQEMRQDEPELFWKAADLETFINQKRVALGFDSVWLTDRLKPLAQATTDHIQGSLFEDDLCDSGYCMV